MKILYLDCYSGISGDMFLGSLIDAGLDMHALKKELSKLPIKGYSLKAKKIMRQGIGCTKFDVIVDKKARDRERPLKEILSLINRSRLNDKIKKGASDVFEKLASSESKVHRKKRNNLHFHEVGDIDSIVDIVGAVIALDILNIDKVYSSRISIGGSATVNTKGGTFPVPAPATLNLLKDKPLNLTDVRKELVTPTGAAIAACFVERFEYLPEFTLKKTGYGAGSRDFEGRPNCLRVMIGEAKAAELLSDSIYVIEANIDDMSPMDYEKLVERLFIEGALDVYLTSIHMKKTRPGILITVLSEKNNFDSLANVLFSESTTIGIRYHEAQRKKLKRETLRVNTKYGKIRLKCIYGPDGQKETKLEYDDYKKIADRKKISLSQARKELKEELPCI